MKTKLTDAERVFRRKSEKAEQQLRRFRVVKPQSQSTAAPGVKVIPLGGQNGVGEKNMIVVEYGNDALVLDCGFELGIDLPGINYAIPATQYLETIRHKLRGYVISHGHLDHIGALTHIVPKFPAPIIGSRFTIGMVKLQFEKAVERGIDMVPDCQVLDMDTHERVSLGSMTVELVRVTHAIPECSAIIVGTPAGYIINTGDFRLDPEPLDAMPSDIARLKQLGNEGVLLLMSESTNTAKPGRTPTEHTLQDSFYELVTRTTGRMFIGVFSSNMNRVQMIINAAHHAGKKVVFDGRSMLTSAELAVKLGNLKIPKGTLVAAREAPHVPPAKLVVLCTGGQGEPGAALSRMATGEHPIFKLHRGDTVVVSSTPIPGNEMSYERQSNDLVALGVTLFRHPTHQLDGCGPLHVSGHACRDEHAEMIQLTKPRFFMPIYGGALNRDYHAQIALQEGISKQNIIMASNGEVVTLGDTAKIDGKVLSGSLLVDQTGAVVPELVTKDRLLLESEGFIVVSVTLASGRLVSSPDIVTRGHIVAKENMQFMALLRDDIRKYPFPKTISRASIDMMKEQLKLRLQERVYKETGQTPLVIIVVTTVPARFLLQ